MGRTVNRLRLCPNCRQVYHQLPAVSRKDNSTLICSDCGTREALLKLGVNTEEQEQILEIIHSHRS